MFLVDSHTHSVYSFDGHATVDEMCEAALAQGVTSFAVTDHYDIDGIRDGFYPPYDAEAARRDVEAAAEKYAGKITLIRGIELGQPDLRPADTRTFLQEQRFAFVIGSCHNLPDTPDFYFIRFNEMPQALLESLFRRSLCQLQNTARIDGIDTIAHPLYPTRYMARGGRTVVLPDFEADFRRLFYIMRECGQALELNLKGMRAGDLSWAQEEYVLRLWYDCGGRRVTCGTDAHKAVDIGVGIAEAYRRLRDMGFSTVCVPTAEGLREYPLP